MFFPPNVEILIFLKILYRRYTTVSRQHHYKHVVFWVFLVSEDDNDDDDCKSAENVCVDSKRRVKVHLF